MLARLEKMRIVGLKYDSMEISTDNLELDFTLPEDEPGHGGYVLRNGGGKGVFLQSLIQTMDPGSSWKGEKNRVTHFFYNNEDKPVYYTFHIVQQWYLTSSKRVVLGFSVAPRITSIGREASSASPIGLDYITYVRELAGEENFDLFQLPLWDDREKEATILDIWKADLKADSSFTVYPMQEVESYKEKIDEYGINEETVSIIKQINISEGGFGDFFNGATDNLGFFYKLLIPTLNDKIEGIDSRSKGEVSSLSVSFLDTLKIAKELPDLLSMIDSIEQINDIILPLKERFEEGKVLEDKLGHWRGKGAELRRLLESLSSSKVQTLSKWEQEQALRQQEHDLVDWKYHNIDYIALHQEKDALEVEYEELEEAQKEKDLALLQSEKSLQAAKVNFELKKRANVVGDIEDKNHKISSLLQSSDAKNVTVKMEEIQHFFNEHWDGIRNSWEREMTRHVRSTKAHETKMKDIQSELDEERENYQELNYQVRDITRAVQEYEERINEANRRYDGQLPYFVIEIVDKVREEWNEFQKELTSFIEKLEKVEGDIVHSKVTTAQKKMQIGQIEEEIGKSESHLKEADKREKELVVAASSFLKEHVDMYYERQDFVKLKKIVSDSLSEWRQKHQRALKKKWGLLEDIMLLDEGEKVRAFIPNKDLVTVKSLLESHKIESIYGNEFLASLSREEAFKELVKNPAIRYGIVVLEDKLESLNFTFIEEELLRNYVVIIDRTKASTTKPTVSSQNSSLGKLDDVNYVLKDLSYRFVEDEVEFEQWKAMIEKESEDIENEIIGIDQNIERGEIVKQQFESVLNSTLKVECEERLLAMKSSLSAEKKQLESLETELGLLEEEKDALGKKIEELKIQTEGHKKKEEELRLLQADIEENQNRVKRKRTLEEKSSYLLHLLQQLEEEQKQLTVQNTNNENSYHSWYQYVIKNFNVLKRMLGNVQMPAALDIGEFGEADLRPQTYQRSLSKEEYEKITEYVELESNLSNKNSRVSDLKAEVKLLNNDLVNLEKGLQQLYGNGWDTLETPVDDVVHLEHQVNKREEERNKIEEALKEIKTDMKTNLTQLDSLQEKMSEKKEELEKDFEEGAQLLEVENCKVMKDQYRRQRSDLKRHLKEADIEIGQLKRILEDINNALRLLHPLNLPQNVNSVPFSEDEVVKVFENPMESYAEWSGTYSKIQTEESNFQNVLRTRVNQIKDTVESYEHLPERYQNDLIYFLSAIRDTSYDEAINNLDNYLEWAANNLQDEVVQKEKAEKAINIWVGRSSRRVALIIKGLQELVSKMTIVNWAGERFPLIKYNKNNSFPTDIEEMEAMVKEFCQNEISRYVNKGKKDIDDLTVRDIAKTVNVSSIVLHVLGDFPKLLIHIPGIEGALLRGEAKYATYKEWEVINNGSVASATKSGGQTLLAQLIVIAMLMRQRVDENSSLFLVTDNPFGAMNANELVEATFSLMDLLKIQWLVVAPPITNVQITSKFNTVYNMSIEKVEGRKVLTKKLIKNHRKFLSNISLLNKPKVSDKDA
ncbi:hypothetical protein [Rossellomorea aquimaris]|uniref:Uncharacterized protein n=1 Tax=Rossellomorea aquimaris TaxID=189382 RepID=A0A5D4TNQ9_9BACI|nr:hypothetical protein [Rossellomorea aquimaris]TYS76589.1 hypothetical protein FZC80_14900 [Rossellomorea aquimaris]